MEFAMYATEFQTIVTDQYIQIPDFERFKNKEVRIIILDGISNNIKKTKDNDFISRMTQHPKKISKDTKFLSRDEANER
jgi:hypothetical protein